MASSVLTGVLMAGTLIAGGGAIYLFVNQSNLPTAEQNTVAQAEGPLPPPARLPTMAQAAQQPGLQAQTGTFQPGQTDAAQQIGSQPAPAAPTVTRLRPVAPKKGGYDEQYDDDGGTVYYEPEDQPPNYCNAQSEDEGCIPN